MNKYNAARAAGYSEACAHNAKQHIEPGIDMTDILEQAGATNKALAETLVAALDAYKVISCHVLIDKDLNVKNKDADGETNDFIEVKDWQTRLNAVKLIADLKKLVNGKYEKDGSGSMETFFVELIKKRKVALENGEGIRITRVEHGALDRFMAK